MIYERMMLDAGGEGEQWQSIALSQLEAQLSRFYPNSSAKALELMERSARANAPRPGGVITTPVTFYRARVEQGENEWIQF